MILVIGHHIEREEHDPVTYKTIWNKGDVVVSHGIDTDTGKTIVLPEEEFWKFVKLNCHLYGGEYYLK